MGWIESNLTVFSITNSKQILKNHIQNFKSKQNPPNLTNESSTVSLPGRPGRLHIVHLRSVQGYHGRL